jgi:sigma-B regulation protein RsbU (phosphoserine phosphatase)
MKTAELINLDSLLDFSSKLNLNLTEDFIINSTLLTILGKLGVCGVESTKFKNKKESKRFQKGKLDCTPQFEDTITVGNYTKYKFVIGNKLTGVPVNDIEVKYVKLILSIANSALENLLIFDKLQSKKKQAEKKSQLLETLFEINRSFSGLSSLDKIIQAIAFNIMGQLTTNKFAVIRTSEKVDILKNNLDISNEELLDLTPNFQLIQSSSDLNKETREKIKIISPMEMFGKVEGYILIGPKMFGQYDEQDYSFVQSLATTAISAIENERLILEEIEKKKYESEMSIASDIQMKLLPKSSLEEKNFSFFGFTNPCGEVGGDYFDYIKISEDKFLFVIADVTGKGVPAAIIMSNIQAAIQALAPIEPNLKKLVDSVNKIVYKNTSKDMFITAFFCLYDQSKQTFEYINAGHFYPLLLGNDDKVSELKVGGVILGFLPSPLEYNSETLKLDNMLVMYTDGLNEATDPDGNELGMEGAKEIIKQTKKLSPKEATQHIITKVTEFSGSNTLSDDISIVVIKRK